LCCEVVEESVWRCHGKKGENSPTVVLVFSLGEVIGRWNIRERIISSIFFEGYFGDEMALNWMLRIIRKGWIFGCHDSL
jgi:hypothetical protein